MTRLFAFLLVPCIAGCGGSWLAEQDESPMVDEATLAARLSPGVYDSVTGPPTSLRIRSRAGGLTLSGALGHAAGTKHVVDVPLSPGDARSTVTVAAGLSLTLQRAKDGLLVHGAIERPPSIGGDERLDARLEQRPVGALVGRFASAEAEVVVNASNDEGATVSLKVGGQVVVPSQTVPWADGTTDEVTPPRRSVPCPVTLRIDRQRGEVLVLAELCTFGDLRLARAR
ncbi:MAG: hypothetical protein IPG50_08135 [Myxococcales bacterium]|nr:hypothetical protein [Myxococcales bacterium]